MCSQRNTRRAVRATIASRSSVVGGAAGWEHEPAPGVSGAHAVASDQVEVTVEVQGSETLNEVDGTALRLRDPIALRPRPVAREDALDEDPPDRSEHVGLEGDEPAKLVGQRQDVLSHGRNIGEDSIDHECACIGHAPAGAGRANAAAAAREGDEQIVPTSVTRKASEAPAEVPTGEVGAELLLNVARQPAFVVLTRVGEEAFELLLDELVEDGFRRSAWQVGRGEAGHAPATIAVGMPSTASRNPLAFFALPAGPGQIVPAVGPTLRAYSPCASNTPARCSSDS